MITKTTYFLLFLLCLTFCKAQDYNFLKNFDYSAADSAAINFPKKKYKNVTEIAGPLTESFTTEHEKFRAIFRWITENIKYNKSAAGAADADKVIRKNVLIRQFIREE